MSLNYPLVNKNLSKKPSQNNKNKYPITIPQDFNFNKNINLEDLFGSIFFKSKNNYQKKFDGNEVVEEALQIGKRIRTESEEHHKDKAYIKFSDELVQNTQISARNNYIENISRKFKLGLHENFKAELIKSSGAGVADLENKLEKLEQTKAKYEMALNEHERLEQKLVDLNNDIRTISQKLFEKNQLINKEQVKFESFKIIQPIFEELIREFPEEEPKELISSFRRNKEKYVAQIHELNKLNEKIYEIENERKKEENRNLKFQNNISGKILQQKQLTDSMVNHYEKEFKIYKDEYEILKNYKKENSALKQLLYNIYLWIIDYINPKKYEIFTQKIGYDPARKKRRFDVTIFNRKEFVALVNENILSCATQCHDGVLLRTTIAFGNYLARRHLKHINKYRYDPVGTFREIKSVIDAKEFENYQLTGVIKNLNQKKINSILKIKELEHQVQKAKIKFQGLLTKFEKYIKLSNKPNRINTISNKDINIEEKSKRSTSAYPTLVNSSYKNKTLKSLDFKKPLKEDKDERKKQPLKEEVENNINQDNNKKLNMNRTVNGFNIRRKFFLTNDGQKGKKKKKGMEIGKEGNNLNNLKSIQDKKPYMTENTNVNDSLDLYSSDDNNLSKEFLQEIKNQTINGNKLKNLQQKKFKDLEISKNRDKLIKTNGFNGSENILFNIKDIMNELLYNQNPKLVLDKFKAEQNKDEINKKDKKRNVSIPEDKKQNKKIFTNFEELKNINNKKDFTTIKRNIKRPLTAFPEINYGKDYKDISNKIMSDIDNIITKVNEIDLHDFSTDQNYKDKRKLNIFTKVEKEKTKRKDSIESLINEKNEENLSEEEESEEEEEEEEVQEQVKENEKSEEKKSESNKSKK